jgi:aldehyde dehydrogenase (NAD+)
METAQQQAREVPSETFPEISIEAANAILQAQQNFFATRRSFDVGYRIERLRELYGAIQRHERDIVEALREDFRKSEFETYASEIGFVLSDIRHAIKHLRSWSKPRRVPTTLAVAPAKAKIEYAPYGVALIISPWNYPFQLLFAPFVGAIAAGNCAVLKPSELAPHAARVAATIVQAAFPPEYATVVQGGVPTNTRLLELRWDYIFFTGGTEVGRIVAQAAAKHLTPTTLELGGKSPCIVDKHANIEVAARRIMWGKCLNAGQTCVAPDYLLVDKAVEEPLLAQMRIALREFYGENPAQSPDYPRIINDRHYARLVSYLSQGDVYVGGETNAAERYIAPTILRNVAPEAPAMQEEIFGPILPTLTYNHIDEAIEFINSREKPLALYLFSENSQICRETLARTSSGGAAVNDVLTHLTVPDLPFGGVGESGIGAYHGKHSFETFSHKRGVLEKSSAFDVRIRYAPYKGKLRWLKKILG